MESIGIVTLASVFNRNAQENERIIRQGIQAVADVYGVYPLIEASLHKEPLKAAA